MIMSKKFKNLFVLLLKNYDFIKNYECKLGYMGISYRNIICHGFFLAKSLKFSFVAS